MVLLEDLKCLDQPLIVDILKAYEVATGQVINLNKSSL